jgi:hypothetical protein
VQCLDGHISTCCNKGTRDLFVLRIMLVYQLYRVVFYYCCSIYFIDVQFSFKFFFTFVFIRFFCFFIVHCSLFKRKILNSDPRLYSRYFDPVVREVPVHHLLCKSNKHHTSACTDFVLVLERMAFYDHRNSRIYRTNIFPSHKASRSRDT